MAFKHKVLSALNANGDLGKFDGTEAIPPRPPPRPSNAIDFPDHNVLMRMLDTYEAQVAAYDDWQRVNATYYDAFLGCLDDATVDEYIVTGDVELGDGISAIQVVFHEWGITDQVKLIQVQQELDEYPRMEIGGYTPTFHIATMLKLNRQLPPPRKCSNEVMVTKILKVMPKEMEGFTKMLAYSDPPTPLAKLKLL